jgi:predicted PurR-regulated permease PerM
MSLIESDSSNVRPAVEISIRLLLIAILLWYCFEIISPFISSLLWGIITAVALQPVFNFVKVKTGFRDRNASILLTCVTLLFFAVPFYFLMTSLINELKVVVERFSNNEFIIPSPPSEIAKWPIIGRPINSTWLMASQNIDLLFVKYESHLKALSGWILDFVLELGSGVIHFILSLLFSGIFLAYSRESAATANKIFVRLAGKFGEDLSDMVQRTIMSVTKGVLGVAVLQSTLAGIGFFIVGIPGAGIWTLFCMILAIIQVGIGLIVLPVIIYTFYTYSTSVAIILTIWLIGVTLLDNVLKPLLLGKGAPVPMPVIFIGVLGGFISFGIIGMFIGAVIFSIGYKLFLVWLNDTTLEREAVS